MPHPQLVFLYGDLRDTSFTLPLCRALAELGGVLYYGEGCAALYGAPGAAGPRFFLLETDRLRSCGAEDALVICKEGAAFPDNLSHPGRLYILANTSAPGGTTDCTAAGGDKIWLGCGCGEGSALALSSLREDSAVVELRRAIPLPGGGAAEPTEIPMRLDAPTEGWPLLCACGVRVLFGG